MPSSRICQGCGRALLVRHKIRFCSNRCQRDRDRASFLSLWKDGRVDGGIGRSTRTTSSHIKRYLRETYKSCVLCGWDRAHPITGKVPLEIDHIDGDSENNAEDNLRLICPNCHSLTPNYKALNKGNGRKWRMEKYLKNPT